MMMGDNEGRDPSHAVGPACFGTSSMAVQQHDGCRHDDNSELILSDSHAACNMYHIWSRRWRRDVKNRKPRAIRTIEMK